MKNIGNSHPFYNEQQIMNNKKPMHILKVIYITCLQLQWFCKALDKADIVFP